MACCNSAIKAQPTPTVTGFCCLPHVTHASRSLQRSDRRATLVVVWWEGRGVGGEGRRGFIQLSQYVITTELAVVVFPSDIECVKCRDNRSWRGHVPVAAIALPTEARPVP